MSDTPPDSPFDPPRATPSADPTPPALVRPTPPGYAAIDARADGADDAPTPGRPTKQPSTAVELALFGLLGVFLGLVTGLLSFAVASSFGPTTTHDAVIRSLDLSFNASGSGSNRTTQYVEGTTDDGREWRLASDEAYDHAQEVGYPLDVEVTFSDWTGAPIAVRADGLDDTLRTGGAQVVWPLLLMAAVVGSLLMVLAFRKHRMPVVASAVYLLGWAPLGVWLGWIAMRAIRGA